MPTESIKDLTEFITDLCENPDKLRAFKKDPEVFIEASCLSDASKAILKSGDSGAVRGAVAGLDFESVQGVAAVVVVVVVVVVIVINRFNANVPKD